MCARNVAKDHCNLFLFCDSHNFGSGKGNDGKILMANKPSCQRILHIVWIEGQVFKFKDTERPPIRNAVTNWVPLQSSTPAQ